MSSVSSVVNHFDAIALASRLCAIAAFVVKWLAGTAYRDHPMPASRKYQLDVQAHRAQLLPLLRHILSQPRRLTPREHQQLMRRHPKPDGGGFYSLANLVDAWRMFAGQQGIPAFDETQLFKLRRKPVRSLSGVTPLTVLTKPFPCPGKCIFCPNDVRMPKSYLADEPGAQRAEKNAFDPYLQAWMRLQTYHNLGHSTDKIEIIVLGGTWSFYPETYQIWFIKRIFDALHDFGAGDDQRESVLAALSERSQFTGAPVTEVVLQGAALTESYNQAVSEIYAVEMQRSRGMAQEIAAGLRPRSPVDEYASWDELAQAQRQNESAACQGGRTGH